MPVHVELETVVIGYAIATKFAIPSNASQVWSQLANPFDVSGKTIDKRAISTQQKDKQENNFNADRKEEINSFATMRWTVYKALAEIAKRCIFFIR